MSLIEELRNENDEINELSDVLSILISNHTMRTNRIFCELLKRFQDKLDNHLKHEARSIYPEILNHSDNSIKKVAKDFMSNINTDNHEEFETETKTIFRLINDRFQMEEAHLFNIL